MKHGLVLCSSVFFLIALNACSPITMSSPAPVPTTPVSLPTATATFTPTAIPPPTATAPVSPSVTPIPPTPTPAATPTPQPNVELRFFFDWDLQDPFNLRGTGLNSKRDVGEPTLPGFTISHAGQDVLTDRDGIARLIAPTDALTLTISIPNTNASPGQKNLVGLGLQFTMTLYEPNRVNYGPRFVIDLRDDQCQAVASKRVCDIGLADGYLTSPYQGAHYLYSSPWTFDSGLNYEQDFSRALLNNQVPSPAGGMYSLGELGKTIISYANTHNRGVPYGYPYLVKDPTRGNLAHLLLDLRNDLGVAIHAPVGGTICPGNSSDYAICAGDVTIDINDIRAIPGWQFGLRVKRGQLIGWTDPVNNITGQPKPFPLIHLGHFEHRNRGMTLAHFPYLTAEQIVMGAKPGPQGQISIAPREQVIANYDFKVRLPHAPGYVER